jgi:1,4-dihydroxy-2-naphthoate octaprenyltransferase
VEALAHEAQPAARGLPAPNSLGAWWLAARPRTLPVAIAPVAVGSAVAAREGAFVLGPALAAAAGALLLQIAANFANDLFDAERGADNAARIGPPRAVQQGLLSPRAMRAGVAVVIAAALGIGSYLVSIGGWPIVAIGLASIAGALAYTGGPYPLAYHGLGEVAVFAFFGVIAVCGTTYVQTLQFSQLALLASLPIGCLASAILVVNNLRDIETDAAANKHTLAVRFGRRGARREYASLLWIAFASAPLLALETGSAAPLIALLGTPLALRVARVVFAHGDGPALNGALAETARLELVFALLLSAGIIW